MFTHFASLQVQKEEISDFPLCRKAMIIIFGKISIFTDAGN